ncbi:Hypothetical predicted protein [Podarcis lilfordi]|uniref:Uncharacterized protein n=1 Tax=Podarcis lilfordi TaxID=74358 RepID=A0AA35PMS4_9SAUR|nr:Hypothetical predicted protein [Podarcis lilfordi]
MMRDNLSCKQNPQSLVSGTEGSQTRIACQPQHDQICRHGRQPLAVPVSIFIL